MPSITYARFCLSIYHTLGAFMPKRGAVFQETYSASNSNLNMCQCFIWRISMTFQYPCQTTLQIASDLGFIKSARSRLKSSKAPTWRNSRSEIDSSIVVLCILDDIWRAIRFWANAIFACFQINALEIARQFASHNYRCLAYVRRRRLAQVKLCMCAYTTHKVLSNVANLLWYCCEAHINKCIFSCIPVLFRLSFYRLLRANIY